MSDIERQMQSHPAVSGPAMKPNKDDPDTRPNWKVKCQVCGAKPTVGDMGLCGPCCFGDAYTVGGNW